MESWRFFFVAQIFFCFPPRVKMGRWAHFDDFLFFTWVGWKHQLATSCVFQGFLFFFLPKITFEASKKKQDCQSTKIFLQRLAFNQHKSLLWGRHKKKKTKKLRPGRRCDFFDLKKLMPGLFLLIFWKGTKSAAKEKGAGTSVKSHFSGSCYLFLGGGFKYF